MTESRLGDAGISRWISRIAGVTAIGVSVIVLLGWSLDVKALKSVVPGLSTMKPNTAIAFVLSGASLWLASMDTPTPATNAVARVLGAFAFALAALTLLEYVSHASFGIDQWLFTDVAARNAPGRMSPVTAGCIAADGVALMLIGSAGRGNDLAAQLLGGAAGLIGGATLIAYAYSLRSVQGLASYTGVAVHTAAMLATVGAGVVAATPRVGLMQILSSPTQGGALTRYLLPVVLIGPFVLGWIRLEGQRLGLYGTEFGVAILAASSASIFAVVVLWYAARVDRVDRARQTAERAFMRSEERLAFALQAAGIGAWETDFASGVVRWSEMLEALHGLAPGTFEGTLDAFFGCIHPDDQLAVREALDRSTRLRTDSDLLYRARWPDGQLRWLSVRGRRFYDDAGTLIRAAGIGMDVTRHREMEDRVRQAQKMEAVGQLAGGIAHDFNNLLTAILGYCMLTLETLEPTHPMRQDIEAIQKAAESAASLTGQLLAFSRRQILQLQLVDLNAVVARADSLLQRLIGDHISLVARTIEPLEGIAADPSQIEQIIMNLAINARDAMPDGGTLTIETANVELDEAYAARHPGSSAGPHVMLAVSDTGTGMDEATQARVFEPFFTTKKRGEGTGLGLATVYGIVKQSGGSIWVYSEIGRGTTFKVYFPRAAQFHASPRQDEAAASRDGVETILIAEDQPEVRAAARAALTRHGYVVLEASGGDEALQIIREYPERIHLLLTDVVMPGMSGRDLVEHVHASHPDIRVLFTSGYTDDTIVRHRILDSDVPFLQKPFTPPSLLKKVRQVLDSAR